MGREDKRHKGCSPSTDVEAEHLNKGTKPLQKAERDLENLETDVNPKKQKIQNKQIDDDALEPKSKQKKQKKLKKTSEMKEMKKLRKSFKEMTETMRNLQEFMQGKASLEGMQLRAEDIPRNVKAKAEAKEEEAPKKTEELATPECNFDTPDAGANNLKTIFVKGFDTSLRRDEIRSALHEHFSLCGKVRRVYVRIECKTGVSLGYAFIDVEDHEKALQLSGSYMGKCQLDVRMARYQKEYCGIPNFHGCKDCARNKMKPLLKRHYRGRHTGRGGFVFLGDD